MMRPVVVLCRAAFQARKLPLDIESIDVMNSGVETLQTCHMESRAAFKVVGL
jgi:hypothetical protein